MKKIISKIYNFSGTWTGTIIIVLIIIFFIAQAFVIPSGSMKNTLLIGDHLFVKKYSYGIPTPHIPWLEVPVLPDFTGNGHIIKGKMPQRGDIVVFRFPDNPKIHYVKRDFAVGGDEVVFDTKNMYLRPNEGDEYIKKIYNSADIVTLDGKLFVKEPYKYKGIHYDPKVDMLNITMQYLVNNKFIMQPVNIKELPKLNGANFSSDSLAFNAFYFKVPKEQFFMVGDNRNHSNDSRFWGPVEYKYIVGKPWFIYFSWNSNKEIRWERIGRLIKTIQDDDKYIYEQP